jgi:hypothetical protein
VVGVAVVVGATVVVGVAVVVGATVVVGVAVVVGATVVVAVAVVLGATVVVGAATKGAAVVGVVGWGVVGGGVSGVVGGASVGDVPGGSVVGRPGRVVAGDGVGGELTAPAVVAVVGSASREADPVCPIVIGATSPIRATAVVSMGLGASNTEAADPASNAAGGTPEASYTTALEKASKPDTSSANPVNAVITWPTELHVLR